VGIASNLRSHDWTALMLELHKHAIKKYTKTGKTV